MDERLYRSISESTAHRASREFNCEYVQNDSTLLADLIAVACNVEDPYHYKACWILELVVEPDIEILSPYLDNFFVTLPHWQHDGAVRSVSKISMFLAVNQLKKNRSGEKFLSETQLQQLTEKCFDWLIGETKVAAKAYAMRALFEIGKIHDWIYPDLKEILLKDFANHSAGYKAAAKDVLRQINRNAIARSKSN